MKRVLARSRVVFGAFRHLVVVYHDYGGKDRDNLWRVGQPVPEKPKHRWLMIIYSYFDESGKFQNQSTISFAGVAGVGDEVKAFQDEWTRHLKKTGLRGLTMKQALRHRIPLSRKSPACGARSRNEALLPFVRCVRRHLQLVTSVAVDAATFKKLPGEIKDALGKDPHYLAFVRILMRMVDALNRGDELSVICDDDEASALNMYRLYMRVKRNFRGSRDQLTCLTFGDDMYFAELQAADMVASLCRLDADKTLHGKQHDYQELIQELKQPINGDRLWAFETDILDDMEMRRMGLSLAELRKANPGHLNLMDLPLS
jgi:hypothetical protein